MDQYLQHNIDHGHISFIIGYKFLFFDRILPRYFETLALFAKFFFLFQTVHIF